MTIQTIDPRLTHIIICDGGQWVRANSEKAARAEFKSQHSARSLKGAQIWAVTPNTRINEHGALCGPRSEFVEPTRIA